MDKPLFRWAILFLFEVGNICFVFNVGAERGTNSGSKVLATPLGVSTNIWCLLLEVTG